MDSTLPARRYEVLAELGAGGMGRVFRARDARLGREVALKRLLPSLASDPAAVERFLREAHAAAAFSHPNAVHVYDVDRDEEGPFIAMELVRGSSLAQAGRLPPRDALRIVRQVGEALAAAHAAGILHRDVKPANVLLDEQGLPRLTDFGLALFEGRGEVTRSLVGTPEFMAPEQAADPAKVDARADVFSLAATLYAALTGEPPRLVREAKIPEALRPALLKALSEKPADRFPSMRAFLLALDAASGKRAQRARLLFAFKVVGALGALGSLLSLAVPALRSAAERPPRPSLRSAARPLAPPAAATPPAVSGDRVAEQPAPEGRFEAVQIHKTVIDSGYAQGLLVNTGKVPLEHARVELKFFDQAGGLVLGATGYAAAGRIEPGAKFPVSVLLKPHPVFARWEARVESQPSGYTEPSARLEVVEKRLEPERFGGWQLFAKVRNADGAAASYPQVAVVVYDAQERIVGVQSGFTAAKRLGPGEESTVSTHVPVYGGAAPARFELFLYGAIDR